MRAFIRETALLGEVATAMFDRAAHYSAAPNEVSRLATRSRRPHHAPPSAGLGRPAGAVIIRYRGTAASPSFSTVEGRKAVGSSRLAHCAPGVGAQALVVSSGKTSCR